MTRVPPAAAGEDDVRARYAALKEKVVERKAEFDEFVRMMETETSWLEAPASTRYHLNIKGGLLRHSVGVAENLLRLRACLAPELTEESCVIVGLFHDAGKVGMPGVPRYLPNPNDWERKNRNATYVINPDEVVMGIAVRSLYLVGKYLTLSDAESQAIVYHDGQYISDNEGVAQKEEALTLLLHWADYWTAHVEEEDWPVSDKTARYGRGAGTTRAKSPKPRGRGKGESLF
jgi:hypothetical protein